MPSDHGKRTQISRRNTDLLRNQEGRDVVKVGVAFDRDTMTVGDYRVR